MRDIKFRVWDENDKIMYSGGELNFYDYYDWCLTDGLIDVQEILSAKETGVLMQYTGLKDKNGKEIYEGDYVRIIYKLKEEGIYEVAWNQEHCCFMMGRMLPDNSDADTVYFGNQFDYEYEVVGNIYENPELLNSEPNVQASVATESDSSNEAENQTP